MIKVYSHPRSGTHFVEAFLANNFYPNTDLSITPIEWGHWANRKVKEAGNPHGKLFGHHYLPSSYMVKANVKKLYIYRDPRAVAYSVWNTENFLHPELEGISFSDFLRLKLDWEGTPSKKAEKPQWNIAQHWYEHVSRWLSLKDPNLLVVRYEDLVESPEKIYEKIKMKFFLPNFIFDKILLQKNKVQIVEKPVGLLPNSAKKDSWKSVFTSADLEFFNSQIPEKQFLSKNGMN